jgi:hypothetical protein
MATVILSEKPNYLNQNGNYSETFLCANKPGQQQLLSQGFWKNLIDGIGDIGSNIVNIGVQATGAAGNIVQGAGQGVGGYVSNPSNIAQIGGAVATGLTGMPVNLQNQPGQQPQNFFPQNQNPLDQLLQNPAVLIGGLALVYLIASKK